MGSTPPTSTNADGLLTALVGQPLHGVVLFRGADLVVEAVNEVYERFFGGRSLAGRPLLEVAPELRGQGFDDLLRNVMKTGEPHIGREQLARLDRTGSGVVEDSWFTFVFQPVLDKDGRCDAVLVIAQDVSDTVRANREITRLMALVEERAAFERQLIGIVSHDIRSPLQTITLGATVLAEMGLEGSAGRHAARMHAASGRAAKLVSELLDFTQARVGGGIPILVEDADLHAIADGVVDEIKGAWPARVVELHHKGDGRGCWDAARVAQVIDNLLVNALKYSAGTGAVVVDTFDVDDDRVGVTVHNGGAPIPAERLPVIFEPLQRATHEHASRSVGLGLFIVQQIVVAHRGTIAVTSSHEAGTTFTVHLPRSVSARAAVA